MLNGSFSLCYLIGSAGFFKNTVPISYCPSCLDILACKAKKLSTWSRVRGEKRGIKDYFQSMQFVWSVHPNLYNRGTKVMQNLQIFLKKTLKRTLSMDYRESLWLF